MAGNEEYDGAFAAVNPFAPTAVVYAYARTDLEDGTVLPWLMQIVETDTGSLRFFYDLQLAKTLYTQQAAIIQKIEREMPKKKLQIAQDIPDDLKRRQS